MPANGPIHERVTLPDGAVVTAEVEVVGYIDPEGHNRFAIRYNADCPTSSVLGLLDFAKFDLLKETQDE